MSWRRNLFAVTAASFIGFTGFTLVMPFLPLYISQLGVSDVGAVATWTGLSLGVTPAVTSLLAPFWGRAADRFGRKIMVQRSLLSFVLVMAAMAYVTRPWHVLALRALQGFFTGYGGLTVAMAAESAPRDRMASAIGTVQTAQRLGPALGPMIGAGLAGLVGLRDAFLVTAFIYFGALVLMTVAYREPAARTPAQSATSGPITFGRLIGLDNFRLLMVVVFGLQLVDRSFAPVLPLHVAAIGTPAERVPLVAGMLFTTLAAAAALGHHTCARLLRRTTARRIVTIGALAAAGAAALLGAASDAPTIALLLAGVGFGVGACMTAVFTTAGTVVPAGAHATGFGILSGASLAGLAISPIASGLLAAAGLRLVFLADAAALVGLGWFASRTWREGPERQG